MDLPKLQCERFRALILDKVYLRDYKVTTNSLKLTASLDKSSYTKLDLDLSRKWSFRDLMYRSLLSTDPGVPLETELPVIPEMERYLEAFDCNFRADSWKEEWVETQTVMDPEADIIEVAATSHPRPPRSRNAKPPKWKEVFARQDIAVMMDSVIPSYRSTLQLTTDEDITLRSAFTRVGMGLSDKELYVAMEDE